jgi:hypothetical protein
MPETPIKRQPFIRDQIIEAIRENPTQSFQKIAADIDHWCSATEIHQWLLSHASYSVYVERMLPLLSKVQMQKHVDFAKQVRQCWGQDTVGKKYLWIHFDKKCFFGWLCRANAKSVSNLDGKNHAFICLSPQSHQQNNGDCSDRLCFQGEYEEWSTWSQDYDASSTRSLPGKETSATRSKDTGRTTSVRRHCSTGEGGFVHGGLQCHRIQRGHIRLAKVLA